MRPRALFLLAFSILLALAQSAWASTGNLPAVGTFASNTDLSAVPGTVPFGDQLAVPLRGSKPSWLTPDLEQQVLAAGGTPVAAPTDIPLPGEVGIRPGSWEISPYGCTMDFVFAKSGSLGIGTAGHCVDKLGQHVILLTLAPGNGNPVLVDIGAVVARHENGIGDDFALVAINPLLYPWVSATTAVIGGPCGAYYGSGIVSVPNPLSTAKVPGVKKPLGIGPSSYGLETVWHYGQGLAIGTGGTPRAGVSLIWATDYYAWDSPAIFGDSGSPVRITDLKAAGNLTLLVVSTKFVPAFVAGTRIGKMLQIASGWSLVNSPLCA